MPELKLDFSNDIFKDFAKLGNSAELAGKMLKAASPIVVKAMKSELSVHSRTGELVNSIKATKPKKNKSSDNYVVVRPTGNSTTVIAQNGKTYTRKNKVRNMEKFASLEFGNSQGQKPTPVIEKVVKSTEGAVLAKMTEVYNKEVEK